jgi:hypothetical protein
MRTFRGLLGADIGRTCHFKFFKNVIQNNKELVSLHRLQVGIIDGGQSVLCMARCSRGISLKSVASFETFKKELHTQAHSPVFFLCEIENI